MMNTKTCDENSTEQTHTGDVAITLRMMGSVRLIIPA